MQPIIPRHVCLSDQPEAVRPAELLFVSDDNDLRAVATRVLEQRGYVVHRAAHSGHAILTCLMSRIDVLVTELWMDDGSGPALADRLRRMYPDLQAVYLAHPGTPDRVDNVLVRPFTRDDLLARIEAALTAARPR
jgi:DNA-binding NtrC family response regulator